MLQRARFCFAFRSGRSAGAGEGVRAAGTFGRPSVHAVLGPHEAAAVTVRQAVGARRVGAGDAALGFEGQEEHAGLAAVCDVGAEVEFRKGRDAGHLRRPSGTHAGHVERDDAEVGRALVGVQFQTFGDVRRKAFGGHRPVQEGQVQPRLHQGVPTLRHRKGQVVGAHALFVSTKEGPLCERLRCVIRRRPCAPSSSATLLTLRHRSLR